MEYSMELYRILLKSWEYCHNEGLSCNVEKPVIRLSGKELIEIQQKKRVNSAI